MARDIQTNIDNIRAEAELRVRASKSILDGLLKCDVSEFIIQQARDNLARHIDRLEAVKDGTLFQQQPWLARDGW